MADVFISHSSKDKVIADKMCEALEARGLKCWIAPRDITPGTEWAVAISDAIATIKVMVVIYSANSAASTQVPKELGLADKRGKFIIPYKIDDTELTGAFDYYLAGAHWIVADIQAGDYKFEELYGVMNGVMQVPLQNITNNTYIDKVTIHTSVPQDAGNIEKSSKKWVVPVGIVASLLLVVAILLGLNLLKSDKRQKDESQETVIENIESTDYREQEIETEEIEETSSELEAASLQDLMYEIKNGEATIVGYKGTAPKVIIPSEIDGAVVTYIAEGAFYQCSDLQVVEIPESVVGIGPWAFAETDLRNVTIPTSVKKIDEAAFCRCRMLEEANLLNGVKEIARGAFSETALKEIIIPNSVMVVGESAFAYCTQLIYAYLPSDLEKVADYMFNGCTSLQQLDIPKSVTVIGDFAFAETFFEKVCLSETNIVQMGAGAFSECPDLKYVELPETLVRIDNGAFQMCYNLETVVVPEEIKAINYNAFFDSINVQVVKGEKVYNYDTYWEMADDLSEKLALDFQYEITKNGVYIAEYIGNDKVVVVPDAIEGTKVTAIGKEAFAKCESMEFLSLPTSINQIEENAFADCINLRTIAGEDGVTEVNYGAYRGTGIEQVEIPLVQQNVEYCMFYGCPYLTSVYIPEGMVRIEEFAFSECKSLTELRIPNSVEQIASNAFDGSEKLTLIYQGHRYSYEERHKIPVMVEVAE
ncbi:MAG: leucine-rich repeat protein [Lachnospiraceae bacterium]|nr:leucine-rich repeat protein [Lachnospiraceae bacterium]